MRQITVSVDEPIVELLDEVAKARRRSRSSLVALILEKWALELEA
jgi:metal-responsive CopG/Arc/MetJ family transcriptional regulator